MNVSETVFPPGPVKTDITDKTCFIGNDESYIPQLPRAQLGNFCRRQSGRAHVVAAANSLCLC
jgi:hypothetical protein